MLYVEIILLLALLQFFFFCGAVGWARGKYSLPAPATVGNEMFERYFRVQMNTLELLVVFAPSLWLFALHIHPHWAAGLGAVYLIGRIIYFRAYTRDPKTRSLGFNLSAFPTLALLLGALVGVVLQLLRS